MSETGQVLPPSSPLSPPPPVADAASSDERLWGTLAHLSAFTAFITGIGCLLGPLIIWLVKRETLPFAGDQAKEALNFNITVALAFVALWIVTLGTFGIGIVLTFPAGLVLVVAWMIFTVIAAMKANEGIAYRYPFALRLVK